MKTQLIPLPILILILATIAIATAKSTRFKEASMYVNPLFQANIDTLIKSLNQDQPEAKKIITNLKIAREAPTAYWLDSMSKVQLNNTSPDSMQGVLLDASKKVPAPTVVFVLYNLPNRDCSSPTGLGEICCGSLLPNGQCNYEEESECVLGLNTYKYFFIDPIVTIINKYKDTVPMAFIIEPHGFIHLIRQKSPRCGYASQMSIKKGLEYAVTELHKASSEFPKYLDLSTGLRLGAQVISELVASILKPLPFYNMITGFAINVAAYQPLGKLCPAGNFCRVANNNSYHACCMDPCKINQRGGNGGNTEINYAQNIIGLYPNKTFVIDTSRNGVSDSRTNCFNWCNIKNAGLGVLPTVETGIPFVDAYLWIKNPGDTDGCTEDLPNGNGKCLSFNSDCGSPDSFSSTGPGSLQLPLGNFSYGLLASLAQNANFVVGESSWAASNDPIHLLMVVLAGVQLAVFAYIL